MFSNFPNLRDPAMILPRTSERSAGSFSGTAANVVSFGRGDLGTRVRFVALVGNGLSLKSYASIEPSQSSLLLWVGVALNGVFVLLSQTGTAFSTQISSFVA